MVDTGWAPSSLGAAPNSTNGTSGTNHGGGTVIAFRGEGGGEGQRRLGEIQRSRMLTAMVGAACEVGAANVTVAHVVARAGVSRRTFYEIFDGCEDCLLAAFQETVERIADRVLDAYERPGRWREKMRAALTALLALFDEDRELARFATVEALGAGPQALERRQQALTVAIEAVEEGAGESNGRVASMASPLAGEAVVGAVFSVIHDRLLRPHPERLIELVNPLMSTIVLPYLGTGAARRELQAQVATSVSIQRQQALKKPVNVLGGRQIRLTYRTVRTIEAVASQPGSSNRTIANAAGISDQGQVSKLLARLHKLGLVQNTGDGAARGEPNSWTLTTAGREIHHAIGN